MARLEPDLEKMAGLDFFGVIVTAPGKNSDFVSRFFAPRAGIPEDPVTGSAHCTLIPYWSERLGRKELHARQLSPRGGALFCWDRGDRVSIGGRAVAYLKGTIRIGKKPSGAKAKNISGRSPGPAPFLPEQGHQRFRGE